MKQASVVWSRVRSGCRAALPFVSAGALAAGPQPTLFFTFEESGGFVNNRGTLGGMSLLNGVERRVAGAPGGSTTNNALEFDGTTANYIDIGRNTGPFGFNRADYTCAAWCYLTDAILANAGDNMVFGSEGSGGTNYLHHGFRNAAVYMGHFANDTTGGAVSPSNWMHVAWRYQAGVQEIYVNGARVAGPQARGALSVDSSAYIARTYGGSNFQGRLDDVAVWSNALWESQIQALAAGASPTNLPDAPTFEEREFYSAPFGPGGTWNLYEVCGRLAGSPTTWYAAHTRAVSQADPSGLSTATGHLATTHSRGENTWLQLMAKGQAMWIGLTDAEEYGGTEATNDRNGGWVWAGTAEPYDFQNWSGGEPNNATASGEDAGELLVNGLWNDHVSGIPGQGQTNGAPTRPYIVEWEAGAPGPIPGTVAMQPILPTNLPAIPAGDGFFGALEVRRDPVLTSTIANIESAVSNLMSGAGLRVTGAVAVVNHNDPQGAGGGGLFGLESPFIGNEAGDDNHLVAYYRGFVRVPSNGVYAFGVHADDGFALRLKGRAWTSVHAANGRAVIDPADAATISYPYDASDANTRGIVSLPAGIQEIELVYFEITGGAGVELYAAPGALTNDADSADWRLVGYVAPLAEIIRPAIKDANADGLGWTVIASAPNGSNIAGPDYLGSASNEVETDAINTTAWAVVNFRDPDGSGTGSLAGDAAFPNDTASVDDQQFALRATATLVLPTAGVIRLGFQSDDGAQLRVVGWPWDRLASGINSNSQVAGDRLYFNVPADNSRSVGEISLAAGEYPLEFLFWENTGGSYCEVFSDVAGLLPNTHPLSGARLLATGTPAAAPDLDGLEVVAEAPQVTEFPIATVARAISNRMALVWESVPGASYSLHGSTNNLEWSADLGVVPSGGTRTTGLIDQASGPRAMNIRVESP